MAGGADFSPPSFPACRPLWFDRDGPRVSAAAEDSGARPCFLIPRSSSTNHHHRSGRSGPLVFVDNMRLLLPTPTLLYHWALTAATCCCLWDLARSFQQVCYLVAPANSSDALPIASVDVGLCSHIIMGFGTVEEDGSINLDPLGGPTALAALAALRKRKPDLKLMISVGGGGGDANFKSMVSAADSRWRFIASAMSALRAARLDGLDLDWEFPKLLDASRFARLLTAAFVEFKKDAHWPLLLSVAVPAQSLLVIGAYDVQTMARSVDFVNLMTYDLNIYNWYTPWVHHNSPLLSRASDPPYFNTLNVESSAKLWVTLGMPKSKIMVGIPTYGLSWVLRDPNRWQVGSLASGRNELGGGFVSFAQVCSLLHDGAHREYDSEAMVPYLHKGKLWISYDDQQSVGLKASWTARNNYGGTMTFSLNSDDWAGTCGYGPFPLQRTIARSGSGGPLSMVTP
ncbi:chitinase-3-like protein 2 isoform X1 [Amblyomma americanum]